MGKAIRQGWQRLQSVWGVLRGHQQGQSLIIITFAFIGILAFAGLAIDLGWVYVERVRVARAADAAALAGASELSLEGAAHRRALVYLQENGYDYTADSVRLVIDGQPVSEIDGVPLSNPPEEDALTTIWIDTRHSRTDEEPNTADRIRVRVKQQVFMTFMQFIGFRHFPVEATAEAESINNLDVVIVYDKSGSMEYDTLCYGCWEPSDEQYPSGTIYPLYWSDHVTESADQCQQDCGDDDYRGYGSNYEVNDCNYHRVGTDRYYIIIEAEEYSRLSVDYSDWGYTPYYTFWVVQRNEHNEYHDRDVLAMGRDTRGAYLSHHPFADYGSTSGLGVSCTWDDLDNGEKCQRGVPGGPYSAPRADYDFVAPRDGNYYIWIRGQGGSQDDTQHVFWGMDGSKMGREGDFGRGGYYDGARGDRWSWRRLSRGPGGDQGDWVYLSAGNHTLHLWAGGAGFDVDRIMITTDNETRSSDLPLKSAPRNNGRTDWACSPCDPRFGGRPGGELVCEGDPPICSYHPDCSLGAHPDQTRDAIYDDEQPIRTALEAAKHFVGRLEPRFDQIGYVRYNERAQIRSELQCVRRLGTSCTPQVITDTVLYELDITRAGGSTNIAQGMQRGIEVLSTGACNASDPHCGRPGAAHIMVLMTDGQANTYPNCYSQSGSCRYSCAHECCMDDELWSDPHGETEDYPCANDCVMYFAQEARDNAIVIYTISLGWSADRELMKAVADLTGGFHRWAPNPDQLNAIFDELYERIFLRLIR